MKASDWISAKDRLPETNNKIDTINPGVKGQLVKIKIPFENLPNGMIIRRKK